MTRSKIWGLVAIIVSLICGWFFIRHAFLIEFAAIDNISAFTYYTIAAPISFVAFPVIGTGFWIGWTILTIKVVPPMPEIVEKKDFSKIKAFILSVFTLSIGVILAYGIYIRSYWAVAIPASVISFVILGAVFWVGIAIVTTRSTLPDK